MADIPKQELLAKLLRMTTSDNDAECLVAIRKANTLLRDNGWDWDKLLAGKIRIAADPFRDAAIPTAARETYAGRGTTPPRPAAQRPQSPPHPAPPPPPPPPPLNTVTIIGSTLSNRYGGICWCCGDDVIPNYGWVFRPHQHLPGMTPAQKFEVICDPCNSNPKLQLRSVRAPRSYKSAPAPKRTTTADLA